MLDAHAQGKKNFKWGEEGWRAQGSGGGGGHGGAAVQRVERAVEGLALVRCRSFRAQNRGRAK